MAAAGEHGGTTITATNGTTTMVCVTGASGFIGSWLVKKLLERGYLVRATVRDPANPDKVKHLLNLPNASTHLSLWKADLSDEGSFDDAIEGCEGVFHVASPMNSGPVKDPENDFIKPTVDGVVNVLKSCNKAKKTVKRIIYASSISTIVIQPQTLPEYDETIWTDVDFCRANKIFAWMHFVAKTEAEKAAWKFAEENGLDLVTIHPTTILGPFLTPYRPLSTEMALSLLTKKKNYYRMLAQGHGVHVEDVGNAQIYLFEHPQAKGRYICSSHCYTIFDVAKSLSKKYPEDNIPTKFEGIDESLKAKPLPSKKLLELGFKFKYDSEEYDAGFLCAEVIEASKEKGLMPTNNVPL